MAKSDKCFLSLNHFESHSNQGTRVHSFSMTSYCDSAGDVELGPLGINYVYLHSCTFQGYEFILWILLFLWTASLIYLLGNACINQKCCKQCYVCVFIIGNTAAVYFSPTLGYICEKLKLPYNIAGVTFLAFGNGSPDVSDTYV